MSVITRYHRRMERHSTLQEQRLMRCRRNIHIAVDGPSDAEITPLLSNIHYVTTSSTTLAGRDLRWAWVECKEFLNSKKAKMVLKCSLAYFLGSLATFVVSGAYTLVEKANIPILASLGLYHSYWGTMMESIWYVVMLISKFPSNTSGNP